MDQYKEFCRLRDYRKPGAEVPQYTEAEAFALATNKCKVRKLTAQPTHTINQSTEISNENVS